MYFKAEITVTIGNAIIQTVSSVKTKNDSTHIGSECDIIVPINCRIKYKDGTHDFLTGYPQNLFKVSDPVTVVARYVGESDVQVFQGFVTDFILGMPTTIKCSDFIFLLNQTTVDIEHKTITLKNLATQILAGTGVTLLLPTLDLTLTNITFRLMSPAGILEYLKKEIGLNISLQGNQLYINVASNTLETVFYTTGLNILQSKLQKPDAVFLKYKVKAWFIKENGTKDSVEVGDAEGHLEEVFFYRVAGGQSVYLKMAAEALNKVKQRKYKGMIETLLYPYCELFWRANYIDFRYPERNADYVVVGMNFELDEKGFHRHIKLAYLGEI